MLQPTTNNKSNASSIDGVRPPVAELTRTNARRIVYPIVKIAFAGVLALVCAVGISHIGGTVSYFSDVEASIGNIFKADPLDFSVSIDQDNKIDVSGGDTLLVATMTPAKDSDPVQYGVTAQVVGGDAALCGALHILATAPFPYDGLLNALSTGSTTETGPWALTVSLDQGVVQSPNTSCSVELVYKGSSVGSLPGQGYKDEEHVPLTFFIPATTTPPVVVSAPASSDGIVEGTSTASTTDQGGATPPPADATSTPVVAPAQDTASTTPDSASTTPATDTPAVIETPPVDQPPPADQQPPVTQ